MMASNTLKTAFRTDVEPILQMARIEKGSAVDPLATYRTAQYRDRIANIRPEVAAGSSGIV